CCGSPRKPGDQRVTRHFCTYFDHRYFDRGMAMHDSLLRHCPHARLWVLCLSDACHQALTKLALPSIVPIRLADFEETNEAMAALRWWRDRCLEWCYDRLEGDRFADQKYLDLFPTLFRGVLVLDHPGANLAPWNMGRHRLTKEGDCLRVDSQPLIFYHFHNFK